MTLALTMSDPWVIILVVVVLILAVVFFIRHI
jgi:hypothetical protein